ncbi:YitT family protein [Malacoplasma iowae]|nr:YitT family protein [Malacoplasma iowae]EGZ31220.1 hypothetical protein GUU_03148 [Malacoplasma iowae 695]
MAETRNVKNKKTLSEKQIAHRQQVQERRTRIQDKRKSLHDQRVKARVEKNNVVVLDNFIRVKLSQSLLKFSSLYDNKKVWLNLLIVFIISVLTGFIGVILLQNTGLYNVGLDALSQGIGRLAAFLVRSNGASELVAQDVFNALFWSIIIVLNIPLIIFGWYKISKRFSLYTSFYVVVSSIFGLSLGFIPGFENVFIFATVKSSPIFSEYSVQFITWNLNSDSTAQLSLFIYGFMFGAISSIFYAVLFILSSSTGGLDFIVVWYAEKKYKDIGTVFTYINIVFFIFSYVIGTYIPASLSISEARNSGNDSLVQIADDLAKAETFPFSFDILFSPAFFSSIIMSIVLGLFLNKLFPKYQMCKVEINSRYVDKLRESIIADKKPYAISIYTIEGGYSRQQHKILTTNCMYVDAAKLLKYTREIDPNALYIVSILKSYDGYAYFKAKEVEQFNFKKWFSLFKKKHEIESEKPHEIKIEVDQNNMSLLEDKLKINSADEKIKDYDSTIDIDLDDENDEASETTFIVGNEIIDEKLDELHLKDIIEEQQEKSKISSKEKSENKDDELEIIFDQIENSNEQEKINHNHQEKNTNEKVVDNSEDKENKKKK